MGALEGQAVLPEPLHAEDPPQARRPPVLTALLADGGRHPSVALEVSRALDREHQEDQAGVQEGSVEFELVAGGGGPDASLLGDVYVPQIAALQDEVAQGPAGRPGGGGLGGLGG